MTTEERILKLERRCRLLSMGLCAAVLSGAVAVFAGAKAADEPSVLKVSRLEVVDENGKVRIELGHLLRGVYAVQLHNSNGDGLARMIDDGQLLLQKGKGQASLFSEQNGAYFQLSAAGQRPRTMMYAFDDHCGLQLRDTDAKVVHKFETPRVKLPDVRTHNDPFGK